MTHSGYVLLVALLALLVVAGAMAAAPRPAELGFVPTMPCEEWFAHPVDSGPIRLEGCIVDVEINSYFPRVDDQGIESALVHVRLPDPDLDPEEEFSYNTEVEPAQLVYYTSDPEILTIVDRGSRAEGAAYGRFVERYQGDVRRVRDVVGTVSRGPESAHARQLLGLQRDDVVDHPYVIESMRPSPGLRAGGLVLFLLGSLGLAIVITAQRRWRRRRDALMGKGEPIRF